MSPPKKNTPERLLKIKEAAIICGVSEKTIRRWIEARELPAAKLGNQWRIRPCDLESFIRQHLNW